jgi:hypothetical protein
VETVWQDLRYALRQLVKSPGFSLPAVLSLALGIGSTTAVFSVLYAALMNPYPFVQADRIFRLTVESKTDGSHWINLNGPQVFALRQSPVVDSVIVMDDWSTTLTGKDLPENVNSIYLSSNGWSFLGVPALRGRGIMPSDSVDGHDPQPVVVLSYKYWLSHFNADPAVLGRTLQLDHKDFTIVGIERPRFRWYSADVYLPLKLTTDPVPTFMVNFRPKAGVTRESANAALQPLLERFAKDTPKHFPEHFVLQIQGLNDWVVKQMG